MPLADGVLRAARWPLLLLERSGEGEQVGVRLVEVDGLAERLTHLVRRCVVELDAVVFRVVEVDAARDPVGDRTVDLQARATSEELIGLAHFADLDLFDDLDEAAGLILALDGVAANDSAIGILAGALGAPTALLMRAGLDRVRLGTRGIPWLPTAKLFDCAWNEPWEAAVERAASWIRTLPSRSSA